MGHGNKSTKLLTSRRWPTNLVQTRESDTLVILLTLKPVNSCHLAQRSNERIRHVFVWSYWESSAFDHCKQSRLIFCWQGSLVITFTYKHSPHILLHQVFYAKPRENSIFVHTMVIRDIYKLISLAETWFVRWNICSFCTYDKSPNVCISSYRVLLNWVFLYLVYWVLHRVLLSQKNLVNQLWFMSLYFWKSMFLTTGCNWWLSPFNMQCLSIVCLSSCLCNNIGVNVSLNDRTW